ncbi:Pet127-domain-containing protein [Gonapodya prolifera JEL478]|uniref:Pet127-domain-containing protein n=1 Tax=Gonapodya prolifera (strain JEL478) TaxID=1344416 RepID=A0A139AW05_GONPJ|nr:Pet127-domain-containing protein [Gonapodya prolifera JEL478]|eukprot:KXS20889.1 Pet127-domain-containing protein [Gonapodya prolifera JEL478]
MFSRTCSRTLREDAGSTWAYGGVIRSLGKATVTPRLDRTNRNVAPQNATVVNGSLSLQSARRGFTSCRSALAGAPLSSNRKESIDDLFSSTTPRPVSRPKNARPAPLKFLSKSRSALLDNDAAAPKPVRVAGMQETDRLKTLLDSLGSPSRTVIPRTARKRRSLGSEAAVPSAPLTPPAGFKQVDIAACAMSYSKEPDHTVIPRLSMGLERVLFHSGVQVLQDPRSRVFNFDPSLKRIPRIEEFDFSLLSPFVPPSQDEALHKYGNKCGARYVASTSSAGSALSQFVLSVTDHRDIDTSGMSMAFLGESRKHTRMIRAPCSVLLHWIPEEGIYAMDAEKPEDESLGDTTLSQLGNVLEKKLTLSKEEFAGYLLTEGGAAKRPENSERTNDSFHYGKFGSFLLRSQIDCHHPSLPKGTFDIKTRATQMIRMDPKNHMSNLGYKLQSHRGAYQSYEREYYDMIRGAGLKWSLQARIGAMDGIFVCHHNTDEIFGFQYIPLDTIDALLFGSSEIAEQSFLASLRMLEDCLSEVTAKLPQHTLRLTFRTREMPFPRPQSLSIFVEAVESDDDTSVSASIPKEIRKYKLECYTTLNGKRRLRKTESIAALVDGENKRVEVYSKLVDETETMNAAELMKEYQSARKECANLRDAMRAASPEEEARRKNFMEILRKRHVWQGDDSDEMQRKMKL